jgi:hypothetical protein
VDYISILVYLNSEFLRRDCVMNRAVKYGMDFH